MAPDIIERLKASHSISFVHRSYRPCQIRVHQRWQS